MKERYLLREYFEGVDHIEEQSWGYYSTLEEAKARMAEFSRNEPLASRVVNWSFKTASCQEWNGTRRTNWPTRCGYVIERQVYDKNWGWIYPESDIVDAKLITPAWIVIDFLDEKRHYVDDCLSLYTCAAEGLGNLLLDMKSRLQNPESPAVYAQVWINNRSTIFYRLDEDGKIDMESYTAYLHELIRENIINPEHLLDWK